ncbi:cell wall-active antibiotics response protein [Micromonospora sp. MA102]|uniref:cell wall-active antibiotics response protein n=1 Tax=Micromonospora sp. MA102 TaxID=2952755 RepID=UPI0021C62788|nr:cell wall-active antibiotics response protein [Micromonospora sp. MA102]
MTDTEPTGSGWSRTSRLLAAAAVLVVALGVAAVVVTLSHPTRLGIAFSGEAPPPARDHAPTPTVCHDPTPSVCHDPAPAEGHGSTPPELTPADGHRPPPGEGRQPGGVTTAAEETLTAPRGDRRQADFELVDPLASFTLRAADLGDDLYRVGAPDGAGVAPRPEVTGDLVRLRVQGNGRSGPAAVEVVLNSRVTWRLRLAGGVSEQQLDLDSARLTGIELAGGASRTGLRLPPLRSALTVRVSGGVSELTVTVPGGSPARVRVAAGAGSVAVYDVRRTGVAAGQLISSPGWDEARDRLDLDLAAGANTVRISAG